MSDFEKGLLESDYKQLGEAFNNVRILYRIFDNGSVYLFSFKGEKNIGCTYLTKEQFELLKSV